MKNFLSESSQNQLPQPTLGQKQPQKFQQGDKTISNMNFSQQVANLKKQYENLKGQSCKNKTKNTRQQVSNSHQTTKEQEQFLSLYEKYVEKQIQNEPIQNIPIQQIKVCQSQTTHTGTPSNQILQPSTSLHQLSHSHQPNHKLLGSGQVKPQQIFNNSSHRFSLDNFRNNAQSTDLRFNILKHDVSLSVKGLRSFMSTNMNNKSSSISTSFNSKTFKRMSAAKESRYQAQDLTKKNINFHLNAPTALPQQSSYFAKISDETNFDTIKYLSFGGRSQTIDQIAFKEQLTGRDSHDSINREDHGFPYQPKRSRYENILQNMIHRNNDQSDCESFGKRTSLSNNRLINISSQVNTNSKAQIKSKQSENDSKERHYFAGTLQEKEKVSISSLFKQILPISQPQSTKNAEIFHPVTIQQTLTGKAKSQTGVQRNKNYFQFPNQCFNSMLQQVQISQEVPRSKSQTKVSYRTCCDKLKMSYNGIGRESCDGLKKRINSCYRFKNHLKVNKFLKQKYKDQNRLFQNVVMNFNNTIIKKFSLEHLYLHVYLKKNHPYYFYCSDGSPRGNIETFTTCTLRLPLIFISL